MALPQTLTPCFDDSVMSTATSRTPDPPLPTGTVTFLLTDVEGSSRRWDCDADGMAASIARHYELIDEVVAATGGARPIEQGEGDSTVTAYARPSDAIAAALLVQQRFAGEQWIEGAELRIRIGVHTGESSLRDESNYFGPAIVRSARLRSIAHGGQVLVSGTTADLVADRLPDGATLVDLGIVRLKDLGRPERVFALRHPTLVDDFPPLRSLDAIPNNLPIELSSFVGREREMIELRRAQEDVRVLTLTGAGGCGKTRLALQLAAELADDHQGGTWLVELAPVADPGRVLATIATALGERELNGELEEIVVSRLEDQPSLLVLDNCEHLLEPCAQIVVTLLRRCPELHVVATSREPLGVPGEVAWRVPSLSTPAPMDSPPADELMTYDAVALFVDRARRARPNFALTPQNVEHVHSVCSRLDGIPLAIELAAARVRGLSMERLAGELDDRFRLLTGGARTVLPRQQTLQASVEWSYDLLSAAERSVFRRLAAFAGGFTLDAAEAVAGGDDVEPTSVLEHLLALVDKSMVVVDESTGRYRLLETLRQYGAVRLVEAPDGPATRDRHLAWAVTLLDPIESSFLMRAHLLPALDVEADNLRTAVAWASGRPDDDAALTVAATLTTWELWRGETGRALETASQALKRPGGSPRLRLLVESALVTACYESGRLDQGVERAEATVAMAEDLDDDVMTAIVFRNAAFSIGHRDAARSLELGLRAVDAATHAGSDEAQLGCRSLVEASEVLHGLRAYDDAAIRATASAASTPWRVNLALTGAHDALDRGRWDSAREHLDRMVGPPTDMPRIALHLLAMRALVDLMDGADAGVLSELVPMLEVARRRGYANAIPFSAWAPGLWELARGDAVAGAAAVIAWYEEVGTIRPHASLYTHYVCAALLAVDRPQEALDRANELLHMGSLIEGTPRWAVVEATTASALLELHRVTEAESAVHRALPPLMTREWAPALVDAIEALASVATTREAPEEAVRLLAGAQAARDRMHYVLRFPHEARRRLHDLDSARSVLGEESFERAWNEGLGLDLDALIAFAQRARGERRRPTVGWESLTPTEAQVVALAADGLSNKEIASALLMGAETVKTHLSHVYDKLGVRSRAALGRELSRRVDGQAAT